MAITFFNNWKTLQEWHLIEVSYQIKDKQLIITIAFIGLGIVIVFNI